MMADFGKKPPQSIELEEAVLGSILIDNSIINEVYSILEPQDFYLPKHQFIYKVCIDLRDEMKQVDILTVVESLKKSGQLEDSGGAYYISELTNGIASSANTVEHCRIIKEHSIKRKLIAICGETIKKCYDQTEDIFEVLDEMDRAFIKINNQLSVGKVTTLAKEVDGLMKEWHERKDNGNEITGVPSKFKDLDRLTCGFADGNLIILAGRPGMGKTTVALQMAKNVAEEKMPVGFISLEMSAKELTAKLISNETEIDYNKILKQMPTAQDMRSMVDNITKIKDKEIYLVDRPSMNDRELKIECRKLVKEYGCKIIMLDYMQLMHTVKQYPNREGEISHISRILKGTAKELQVPIIALAQLSRNVEHRTGKIPQLSDLRESGQIEQDADMVIFAYRPEYYDMETFADNTPAQNKIMLKLDKHRGGQTGDIITNCYMRYSQIFDESGTQFPSNEVFQ